MIPYVSEEDHNEHLFINQSPSLLQDYPPSVGRFTKKALPSVIEMPYVAIASINVLTSSVKVTVRGQCVKYSQHCTYFRLNKIVRHYAQQLLSPANTIRKLLTKK